MAHVMHWFRRDLRASDNTALAAAARDARAAGGGVIGLFVVSPAEWAAHDEAPVKVEFWLRNLRLLSGSLDRLNIPLVIERAESARDVPRVVAGAAGRLGCAAVHFNREHEIDESRRDEAVARLLSREGRQAVAHHDQTIVPPGDVRTGEGRFFTVFTPFRRALYRHLESRGVPPALPSPRKQEPTGIAPSDVPARVDGFESGIDPALWPAGEKHARAGLSRFIERSIRRYKENRDFPAIDGTSSLSPYLHSGVISIRQCLHAAIEANGGALDEAKPGMPGPACWISELAWREFYKHITAGFPRVCMGRAFRTETERIVWNDRPEHLAAWREGRTGVPIVDAAMRALAATGWMHNRLRMIVAMYLTKDLFLDWRLGERHFMRTLIDGDLASNNGGWQWSASTGTDAAPYFRIFNPVSQSRRFDPEGAFIRRWVPELRGLDGEAIHDPGALPPLARARLDYPEPLVDRALVRDRVLAAFGAISIARP